MIQFRSVAVLLFAFVPGSARGHVFSGIVDVKEACPPDSSTCAHGGIAFRDMNHGCEFTPCEFVTPRTNPPTPSPTNPRATNSSQWFRNHEFYIPRMHFRELARGYDMSKRVTQLLQMKSQRASQWVDFGVYTGCVDLYAVPARFAIQDDAEKKKTDMHERLLLEALSTGGDSTLAEQSPLLVASTKPWTRLALFGWLAKYPTSAGILKMLHAIQDANSLEVLMKGPLASKRDVLDVVADVAPKQIVAIPSFVITNAEMGENGDDDESRGWFAKQPDVVQVQVFDFLERRLFAMGHLEFPPSKRVVRNATTMSLDSDNTSSVAPNRSVGFASRYKKASASLAAFLTPFPSLLGNESGKNNASLWLFTMMLCDAHEKMVREQSSVPLTLLVKPGNSSSSSSDQFGRLSNQSAERSWRDANSSSSATHRGDHVFSCWFYQQIEDLSGAPITNPSTTMHAVRFYH